MDPIKLIEACGKPYSKMLGIDLARGDPAYVQWLLASILYAKPIREESATKTFKAFESAGIVDARSIVDAGWDRLVSLLDKGGYARYDYSTADRLLDIFGRLESEYGGRLQRLYGVSKDGKDLEHRILALGKGIGPVTVSVFLRDMQKVWPKARPALTPRVIRSAETLGIRDIEAYARKHHLDIVELETALHRYSRGCMRDSPRGARGVDHGGHGADFNHGGHGGHGDENITTEATEGTEDV
jgi:hypothetical protein